MKGATCLAAPASWAYQQGTAPQIEDMIPENSVNATQIYKALDSKKTFLARQHPVKQKNADKAERR